MAKLDREEEADPMGYEGIRWAEPKRPREKRGWAAFCLQAAVLAAFVFLATWVVWG